MTQVTINESRLHDRLETLRGFGAMGTGVSSMALTETNKLARDQVKEWMEQAGLKVSIDKVGNIIGIRPGKGGDMSRPPVMVGSHIDTVQTGGAFDGRLGVLAGISAVEAMNEAGIETDHPVAVAVFTAEEGARYQPAMIGSAVFTGKMSVQDAYAIYSFMDRSNFFEELERIGYVGDIEPGFDVHAFLELHIEQGRRLEAQGRSVAPVHKVQGISQNKYILKGDSTHAGGAPMEYRTALPKIKADLIAYAYELAYETEGLVVNAGYDLVTPGNINVDPAEVEFTLDIRSPDPDIMADAQRKIDEKLAELMTARQTQLNQAYANSTSTAPQVSYEIEILQRLAPANFHPTVVASIQDGMTRSGVENVASIILGAGHDACNMAEAGIPTAMIAVQSVGGKSHNLEEFTKPEDIALSANTLLNSMLAMDKMEFIASGASATDAFFTQQSDKAGLTGGTVPL